MPEVVPHFPSPASLNIETAIQDLKTNKHKELIDDIETERT